MRHIALIIGALLLITAITPVSAVFVPNVSYDNTQFDYFDAQVYSVASPFMYTPDETGVTAFCTALGHGTHTNEWTWKSFSNNATAVGGTSGTGYSSNITVDSLYNNTAFAFSCGGAYHWGLVGYKNTTIPAVTANFTATPLQGGAPIYVSFTDTSSSGPVPPTSWNWTILPATGWAVNPSDLDNEDITVLFTANGNYSISHGVSNGYSSDIENKTDYIWIYNATSMVTTPFTAIDLAFANPITGASISLYDIGNSSWTNGTTGADGKVSITTLEGHLINGYATATGYDDAELLGVDAYSGGHTFYMYPSGYTNVSSGNVTVFISVVDDSNFGTALPGVTVTGMVGSTTQVGTTDAAGIARFVFPNSTDVHFGATKAGYAGTTVTINTGIPSGGSAAVTGTIHMFRGAVTATPTITGGATTTITVDPYPCVGDGSYQDTLNCQRKQGEMGADLIAYGPDLVNFFIMLTFIGGLALMMKGFR